MHQLGRYVVALTIAALISGILLSLFPKGWMRSLMQLVCGVFLTITALSPVMQFSIPEFTELTPDYRAQGEALSALGENLVQKETLERIKTTLEAYILDKAAAIPLEISAEVSLTSDGIPESVILTGNVSEDARQKLESILTNDLGIPKERQQWIG